MALFRNVPSLIALIVVSIVAAEQPEAMSQTPQPLRSFPDRQDKFNGNYNEDMDTLSSGSPKRLRAQASTAIGIDSNEQYSGYYSQGSSRARQQLSPSRYQYDDSVDYDTVNRNGDPAYYSDPSPASYQPASK